MKIQETMNDPSDTPAEVRVVSQAEILALLVTIEERLLQPHVTLAGARHEWRALINYLRVGAAYCHGCYELVEDVGEKHNSGCAVCRARNQVEVSVSLVPRSRIAAMEGELAAVEKKLMDVQALAGAEIRQLKRRIDKTDELLQEYVDDASYEDISDAATVHRLYKCAECSTAKGAQHSPDCVVGKAEAYLRHWES